MNYRAAWQDADLEMFRDSVRKFAAAEYAPHDKAFREQQYVDKSFWLKAGEMGLLCIDIPEEYGGMGADFRYEVVMAEEFWGKGYNAFGSMVHTLVANYLMNHGTEEQKKKFLPRLASGELIGAIAMSEPGAGSDLQSIQTKAAKHGDSYIINGAKTWISNGYNAGLVALVCKTDPREGAKGMSIILIETDGLEGFKTGSIIKKIGQKGQDTCELFFDDVTVPVENLLGGVEGQGFIQLMSDLPYERILLAAAGVGAMEAAFDMTVEYTKDRKVFGQQLIDMQTSRHKLAELKTTVHIARVFVDNCIQRQLDGTADTTLASMAKYWVTDKQCEVIDACLQFFGGNGYTEEYPISQFYLDARVQRIYGGANEIMKEVISRSL
ncbi:MAG: acyl-CoA dehydrogenase family protein [Parvibaculales bacterium]|jgi:acyl-CoA dehydrogenase